MKKLILLIAIGSLLMLGNNSYSQTAGTLTVSYNQPIPTSPSGTKNVYAVWIENGAGAFIKTKMRFWGVGNTDDHLPTWVTKSGQSALTTIADATTGATRTSSTTPTAFGSKTATWDGHSSNGTVNGALVADGVYKVWVESSWQNSLSSNAHNAIISFSFTKGAATDHQTYTGDNYFNTIVLDWVPTTSGFDYLTLGSSINVYPNPSNGYVNVDLSQIPVGSKIQIHSIVGKKLFEESVEKSNGVKTIDMNGFENGIYLVNIQFKNQNKAFKVVLNK